MIQVTLFFALPKKNCSLVEHFEIQVCYAKPVKWNSNRRPTVPLQKLVLHWQIMRSRDDIRDGSFSWISQLEAIGIHNPMSCYAQNYGLMRRLATFQQGGIWYTIFHHVFTHQNLMVWWCLIHRIEKYPVGSRRSYMFRIRSQAYSLTQRLYLMTPFFFRACKLINDRVSGSLGLFKTVQVEWGFGWCRSVIGECVCPRHVKAANTK